MTTNNRMDRDDVHGMQDLPPPATTRGMRIARLGLLAHDAMPIAVSNLKLPVNRCGRTKGVSYDEILIH
jgi:hypothetical protein